MNPQELVAPVADHIRRFADQAEQERKLPDELMRCLREAGLFAIYTPREFGGMQLPLPEALRVVEETSRHDGSTGWTVALGFANGLLMSCIPDETAARVFRQGSALIAGAPGFMVQAQAEDGGYRLTGQWQFCSGAPNADWQSVAAPIFEGDAPRMGPSGPEMIFALIPPSEVEILDTWHVTGLRGTGSHDLKVDGVFVPEAFTGRFSMPGGPHAVRPSPLTRIPFTTALGTTQSPAVCLGIARRAIEEFISLAREKERPFALKLSDQVQAQVGVARAEALLESARSYWYDKVDAMWDKVSGGDELSLQDRTAIRLASLTAAENSAEAVNILYRLAGSTAIFQSSPLERCWRDVHTALQHMQVQHGRWETAGRVLFGLEPDNPFV